MLSSMKTKGAAFAVASSTVNLLANMQLVGGQPVYPPTPVCFTTPESDGPVLVYCEPSELQAQKLKMEESTCGATIIPSNSTGCGGVLHVTDYIYYKGNQHCEVTSLNGVGSCTVNVMDENATDGPFWPWPHEDNPPPDNLTDSFAFDFLIAAGALLAATALISFLVYIIKSKLRAIKADTLPLVSEPGVTTTNYGAGSSAVFATSGVANQPDFNVQARLEDINDRLYGLD